MSNLSMQFQMGMGSMDFMTSSVISSYMRNGNVFDKKMCNVTLTVDEMSALISEAIGIEPTVVGNTHFYQSDKEYVQVTLVKSAAADCTMVNLVGCFFPTTRSKIMDTIKSNLWSRPRRDGVYFLNINHHYIDVTGKESVIEHNKSTEDFENVREDMYPLVNVPLLMQMYSESEESNLILTGDPGTGKTCFVKKCLREIAIHEKRDLYVVYVKDRNLLAKDNFWAKLSKNAPDVLVLDDLDDELLPRTEGRNPIVNNMLSFSDGLFDLKTKVIITTNQPNTAIDKALIRPGRCFDILALPNLTWEQAQAVWVEGFKETATSFASVFGTASAGKITQAALMSEYQRFTKTGAAPYLLDASISIRKTVEDGGVANG